MNAAVGTAPALPTAAPEAGPAAAAASTRSRTENAVDAVALALFVTFAGAFPLILSPGSLFNDTDVLPKVLATRATLLTMALLFLARALAAGRLTIRRTPLDLAIAGLVASAALSTLLSVNVFVSLQGTYTRYEGLITTLTYAGLYFIGCQFITSPRRSRALLTAMVLGAAVECAIACVQSLHASSSTSLGVYGETATTFNGFARALGTMANANNLAIWLAMLLPVVVGLMRDSRSTPVRLAGLPIAGLMALALILTFGRAAWLGAVVGSVVALGMGRARWVPRLVIAALVAGTLIVVVASAGSRLQLPLASSVVSRAASVTNPLAGSAGTRLHLYSDTISMVERRPLVGYGPDTYALVHPAMSAGDWTNGTVMDKAHSDILQTAATQGLIGVAAGMWVLVAIGIVLVRSRESRLVGGLLGAVLAYEVGVQLNFAWFPVTAPFWMLVVAAAGVRSSGTRAVTKRIGLPGYTRALMLVPVAAVAALSAWSLCVQPGIADIHYRAAQGAWAVGDRVTALAEVSSARRFNSLESTYSTFEGDLAANLAGEQPGPGADLLRARSAYEDAIAKGAIFPTVPLRLAYVDLALGDRDGAIAAARLSRDLDPYGPAPQLLAALTGDAYQ